MEPSSSRRHTSVHEVATACKQTISANKIEQLRSRPEKNPTEKFQENHAVSEELKKQITELSQIRKTETVDSRIEKIEAAIVTLKSQTKPLKKALNSALYSTDSELLELAIQTTRETLIEIGSNSSVDPTQMGLKVAEALENASKAIIHYTPNEDGWCSEWKVDEDIDEINDLYSDLYKDSSKREKDRFGYMMGLFHRYDREFHLFSRDKALAGTNDNVEEDYIEPAVYPFNVDSDFMLQLIDVERVEKQKKVREKQEKVSRKKETAELVKVSDKALNIQSEEVSISRELQNVLKILKAELKSRNTDKIPYYEFITNPTSFSRTVENMFYVSYLMRDREVYLIEEDNVIYLFKPNYTDDEEKRRGDNINSSHGLTPLSFEQWKRLSKTSNKSIIKPLEK